MIKDKRFKKFYEVGANRYYVLKFDNDLFLATESFLELPKRLFKNMELTQSLKMVELTTPILTLFNYLISTDVIDKDEEFPDMTTYEVVDNKSLRDSITTLYEVSLNDEIIEMRKDFEDWCNDFIEDSLDKYSDDEIKDTIKANTQRFNESIENFKKTHISNYIDTRLPKSSENNSIVKKMISDGLNFLYSHKLSSTSKIYYLYDLDKFGTITIYRVLCVKEVMKSVNSFVYNRELIQELLAYIENNRL